jgi:hypothetical protein
MKKHYLCQGLKFLNMWVLIASSSLFGAHPENHWVLLATWHFLLFWLAELEAEPHLPVAVPLPTQTQVWGPLNSVNCWFFSKLNKSWPLMIYTLTTC